MIISLNFHFRYWYRSTDNTIYLFGNWYYRWFEHIWYQFSVSLFCKNPSLNTRTFIATMHTACTKKLNFYMSFSLTNHSRENFIYSCMGSYILLIFLHADKLEELKFTKRKSFWILTRFLAARISGQEI